MILMHDFGCSYLPVNFPIELSIIITLRQIKNFITDNDNGLQVFCPHRAAAPESAEVAIRVCVDTRGWRSTFPCRAYAENAPVSGTAEHAPQHPARPEDVHFPHKMGIPYIEVTGADGEDAETVSASRYDKRIHIGKPQSQSRTTATVTLRILVMIGRFESAHGFAHKGKYPVRGPIDKDEWLVRIIPWFVCMPVYAEQQRSKAASACHRFSAFNILILSLARGKIDLQDSKLVSGSWACTFPSCFSMVAEPDRSPPFPGMHGDRKRRSDHSGCTQKAYRCYRDRLRQRDRPLHTLHTGYKGLASPPLPRLFFVYKPLWGRP